MYDLDWAKEFCGGTQHVKAPFKESLYELIKITLVYIVFLSVSGGSLVMLNYIETISNSNKKIQTDGMYNQNNIDTLNIKPYSDIQEHFKQSHNTVKIKHR